MQKGTWAYASAAIGIFGGGYMVAYPDQKIAGTIVMLIGILVFVVPTIQLLRREHNIFKNRGAVAALCIAIAAFGFIIAKLVSDPGNELIPKRIPTSASIEFPGGMGYPMLANAENIRYIDSGWIAFANDYTMVGSFRNLQTDSVIFQSQTSRKWEILLTFEYPIIYSQVVFNFSNPLAHPPSCKVRVKNARMVLFESDGNFPEGTLEVTMK